MDNGFSFWPMWPVGHSWIRSGSAWTAAPEAAISLATDRAASQGGASGVWATLIHTLGYFTVTAAAALLVYQKFGLAMLRRSWFNLDLIWAVALVITGFVALVV